MGAEVPLVLKRRRLMKAGERSPTEGTVGAEGVGPGRDVADQRAVSREWGRVQRSQRRPRRAKAGKKGRQHCPWCWCRLRLPKEEPAVRRKQATKAERLQALTASQDMLYAAPVRLGLTKGTRLEANASGAGQSEEETSDESRPYVPDWPRVTRGSTLASAEDKLEWLQNCLPPNVLEGYKELGASSVIGLHVQSALLVRSVKKERRRGDVVSGYCRYFFL